MTKVIFNETLAGVDFVFHAGKTHDIDEQRATKWINAGLCRLPLPTETADARPEIERAEAKPAPKRKRRVKKVEE